MHDTDIMEQRLLEAGDEHPLRYLVHKPDGRRCILCAQRDNDWDPVAKARDVRVFMWWAYPPDSKTGQSSGRWCGYCAKICYAQVKLRLGSFKNWLDEVSKGGQAALECHLALVEAVQGQMIESGKDHHQRVDWTTVKGKSLAQVQTHEADFMGPAAHRIAILQRP